jgi:hypothetical protein
MPGAGAYAINIVERSAIKHQLTVAKLPLAKDVDDFAFKNMPINEALVRDLAGRGFLAQRYGAVRRSDQAARFGRLIPRPCVPPRVGVAP